MILGLQKDPNFKFEKDWEFFTNMFKKQVQKRVLDTDGRIDLLHKADVFKSIFRPSTGR